MKRGDAWLPVAASIGALHGAALLALPHPAARAAPPPRPPIDVAFEVTPPRPAPPPPAPDVVPLDPAPSAPRVAAAHPARQVAPAPAAAAQVLDAPADAAQDAAVDFTMVQGDAERFTGGVTASNGRVGGAPGVQGSGASAEPTGAGAASTVDRSAPARPASAAWSCSHLFPAEADAAGVHHAVVRVAVKVGPDGSARNVTILSDPGHGFAAAARACARGQRYVAARDARGEATAALTAPFSVRFTR